MSAYDVIYLLKPKYETEPDWWKLRWRPIWRQTYSLWCRRAYGTWGFGFFVYRTDATNGWHRSFSHLTIRAIVFAFEVNFWVRWNFIIHKDGPSDVAVRRPLEITSGRAGS